MAFLYENISCQNPANRSYINRNMVLVRCEFLNNHSGAQAIRDKALALAKAVNPRAANASVNQRDTERLIIDGLGGVLAEHGWYYYIRQVFGPVVEFTDFTEAHNQIDLLLNNGKSIEVRSSFPRNGAKFAVCSERFNFKNICKYDNIYKPSETDKDFFSAVLFETPKDQMLEVDKVVFYLVGGSTKAMMMDKNIAIVDNLIAEGDTTSQRTNYLVIKLKDALDITGFEQYMIGMGYQKQNQLAFR